MIYMYIHLLRHTDPKYINWRASLLKRPPPWNKGKTKETHPSVKKLSETFKTKGLDNFCIWRQKRTKNLYQPFEHTRDLAFMIGLILGDGYLNKDSRTEVLRITLGTDKPKLWQYAAHVMKQVFRKHPQVQKRSNSNCMNLTIYENNLASRLQIPLGSKRYFYLQLPQWIWQDNDFLIQTLKGLFEAEGSFSIHLRTYTYNLSFCNVNKGLLDEVEKALFYLGFHPERRPHAIRLRKKAEALTFEKLINFRRYP